MSGRMTMVVETELMGGMVATQETEMLEGMVVAGEAVAAGKMIGWAVECMAPAEGSISKSIICMLGGSIALVLAFFHL
jgi:hypothetical protein